MRARVSPLTPLFRFLFIVVAAVGAVACHLEEAPDLLSVHRLDPPRASSGDRVVVTGEGFPEGRRATVIFRGDVFRAGLPPETDVRIVMPATPEARNAVVVAFDGELERRFVGKGGMARHATFRGDVRVIFQPSGSGMAPVGGSAHDVRFEVLPSTPGAATLAFGEDPVEEGGASLPPLSFLGAAATWDEAAQRLEITAIDPQGRAAAAGLLPGDQLLESDGVTVLTEGDLQARPGQHLARYVVERAGRVEPPLSVDVEGLSPRGSSELLWPAALVFVLCVLLGAPVTRAGVVLRWLAQRIARNATRRDPRARGVSERRPFHALGVALLPLGADRSTVGAAALVVLGAVTAWFVRLAVGHPVISPDLDLAALALGGAGALVATRFAGGGRASLADSSASSDSPGWSLLRALQHAGRGAACVVPALLAITGAVLASGRFVLSEMVAEQGGVPWRWAAMRNPGLFLLCLVLVASTIPEVEARPLASIEGLPEASGTPSTVRGRIAFAIRGLAEWAYLWIACGLAVTLFLGGWRLPGVSSVVQEASRSRTLLGAALFVAKLGGLVAIVGALRALMGRLAVEHVAGLAARWVLPMSALACAFTVAWTAVAEGARSFAIADLSGFTALGVTVSLAAFFAVAAARGRHGAAQGVNPWL